MGLSRNDIVPRDPVHGRGPASYYRPRSGVGAISYASYSDRDEECPADLIPGVARNLRFLAANQNASRSGDVLALHPQSGNGSSTRSRSSFPSTGCDTIAPQEPVYWWLLPSPTCARATVLRGTSRAVFNLHERASSPPYHSFRSRWRAEAPRYRVLNRARFYPDFRNYNFWMAHLAA